MGNSEKDSKSKSINKTVSGSHQFTVKGYSLAKRIGPGKCLSSDVFTVGGCDWAILFYCDGKNPEDFLTNLSNKILKKEGMKIYSCYLLMLLFLKILHSRFMLRNMLRIRKHSLRIMLKPMPNSATLGQNLILLRWVIKTHVLMLESTLICIRTQTMSLKYLSGHPWIVISIACAVRLGSESKKKLEVQKHLNRLNKPPVKSIKNPDGDIIDWVHISHQQAFDHPYLKDHKIQRRPSYHPKGLCKTQRKNKSN